MQVFMGNGIVINFFGVTERVLVFEVFVWRLYLVSIWLVFFDIVSVKYSP